MVNKTGNKKKSRYGLAWKTSDKAGIEKILDLKTTQKNCILVSDNSEEELNNITTMLKKYNYEVIIIQYEQNAIKIFRNKRYDLLIKVIPDMVRIDFLGQIKTFIPETEVMIVTGLDLLESCLITISSGTVAYQSELNKAQKLDRNSFKDFLQNELRLLSAMDFYLERYCF